MKYADNVKPYAGTPDLAAFDSIRQEFGGIRSQDPKEEARRERVIALFIQRMPRTQSEGASYPVPYSYGLHLRALRDDQQAFPQHYREWESERRTGTWGI